MGGSRIAPIASVLPRTNQPGQPFPDCPWNQPVAQAETTPCIQAFIRQRRGSLRIFETRLPAPTVEASSAAAGKYDTTLSGYKEGSIIKGTVVRATADDVFVDINFKSEGVIPRSEFKEEEEMAPGHRDRRLSRTGREPGRPDHPLQAARRFHARLDRVREAFEREEMVMGLITRRIKGGRGGGSVRHRGLFAGFANRFASGSRFSIPCSGRRWNSRSSRSTRFAATSWFHAAWCWSRNAPKMRGRDHRHPGKGPDSRGPWSRTSPISAAFIDLGAWTACCTSPTYPGAA